MIDFFKQEPVDFAPGERWAYNNSGYFLLGEIIEKVSGMTYWDFLEPRIFKPLGMKRTRWGGDRALIDGRAAGYERTPRGLGERRVHQHVAAVFGRRAGLDGRRSRRPGTARSTPARC